MTGRSLRCVRGVAAALLAVGLLTPPAAAEESLGMTLGTGLANLVYLPAKVAYAAGGTVVGGLAWVFSGGQREVATRVVEPSVRGDYVLTPDHLRGERPIVFVGRDAGAPEPAAVASAEVPPDDVWAEAPEAPWPEEGGSDATWGDEWGDEARWEEAEIAPSRPAAEAPDALADEDDFWNPREPEPAPRAAPARAPDPAPAPESRAVPRPDPDWDRRAPVRVEELPPVAAPPPRDRAPRAAAPVAPPADPGPAPVWVYEPRHRDPRDGGP